VVDAGDVEMYSGDIEAALPALQAAVEKVSRSGAIPSVLGGDHSIAYPDAKGVANVLTAGCRCCTSTCTPTPATSSSARCGAMGNRCAG
jgi:hypothetical protein